MSLFANTSRQQSSLAFFRLLVRAVETKNDTLTPEMRTYVFRTALDAAKFVQHQTTHSCIQPEAIEMAFEIADERDLIVDLSKMDSPQEFDPVIARRVLNGLDKFAAA